MDSNIGLIEERHMYDFTELNEMKKYKWTNAVLKTNIISFVCQPTGYSNNDLMILYRKFMDFNHYSFVQKLNGILKSEELFCFFARFFLLINFFVDIECLLCCF